jgi:hypothetical protein
LCASLAHLGRNAALPLDTVTPYYSIYCITADEWLMLLLTRLLAAATPLRATYVTVTTGTCVAPGEVAHSLWMEVCASYNCATTPARPVGSVMPDVVRIGRAMGGSGAAPRHDLDTFAPHSYCLRWFPWRRIAPARHQPRNVIQGEWAAVRVTADCHGSARKVAGVSAGPGGARMPAAYARKSLRVASACRVPEAIA